MALAGIEGVEDQTGWFRMMRFATQKDWCDYRLERAGRTSTKIFLNGAEICVIGLTDICERGYVFVAVVQAFGNF